MIHLGVCEHQLWKGEWTAFFWLRLHYVYKLEFKIGQSFAFCEYEEGKRRLRQGTWESILTKLFN